MKTSNKYPLALAVLAGVSMSGLSMSGLPIPGISLPGLAGQVHAAQMKKDALEEIVVTGTRQQIRSSIDAKTEALVVADFIAADDFAKQPDLNLADSLRRLPGVTAQFDEDEGRFVSIRGLPSRYSTVALNGVLVPNAWGAMGREQNIEALPAFAIKRSGVYKSLTPDIDGNAIGGYIDNQLVSAFDHDDFTLATDVRMGSHSYLDTPGGESDPSPKVQFLASDLFGDNNQFGYVFAAHYFDKRRDQTKTLRRHRYQDDIAYINRVEALDYSNTITRWSALGRLEYRSEKLYTALSASRFDYQYDEVRYFFRVDGRGGVNDLTATSGSFEQGRAETILDRFPIHTETDLAMWDLRYDFDNGAQLTSNLSYGEANYELFDDASSINFRTGDLAELGYSYDLNGQSASGDQLAPVAFNDPAALVNADNYTFVGDFWPRADRQGQEIVQAKIDYAQGMDKLGFGYKVGLSLRSFESFVDNNRDSFFDPVDDATFPSAAAFIANNIANSGLGISYPAIDPGLFLDYFRQNPEAFKNNLAKGQNDVIKGDLDYQEDIVGAYAMLSYQTEKYQIAGGFRYEQTDWDSTGVNNSLGNDKVFRSGDYSNWLASLVGYYRFSDELKLRFGFNQSIGRPNPSDLARRETVSENAGVVSVSRGNPNLQPREADNYDIALEYNLGDGSFVALGYFYKDLTNEIFTFKDTSDTVDEFGEPAVLVITQPTNLSQASVQGVEFTFIDDKFDFLPAPLDDFGFTSNLTWLDADLDLPQSDSDASDTRNISLLNGSPRWKANASLLYERGPFEAKLTLAHRDDVRVSASSGQEGDDLFEEAYSQWDMFARYTINDQWNVFVEGRNITDEVRLFTNVNGIIKERNEFGRSWWVGASFKF